jgi:ferredoxin
MPQDVKIFITDRNGVKHEVLAPTDMNMNIMELIRSYELAEEGTVGVCGGMAMCASCQCYVLNDVVSYEEAGVNKFIKDDSYTNLSDYLALLEKKPCFGKPIM